MKTHILFALFTAFLMTACASKESRGISSVEQYEREEAIHTEADGFGSREFGRQ